MQEIVIIAAMAQNRVIGKDGVLPWSIKEDMKHFKELTTGWPCVMGRKTWESLPKKPLPGRLNIIVSKTLASNTSEIPVFPSGLEPAPSHAEIVSSLPAAIGLCSDYQKVFIIGGEAIYAQALSLANKIELTLIHGDYEGDTFFPEIDANCWALANTEAFDNYSFLTYTKKSNF